MSVPYYGRNSTIKPGTPEDILLKFAEEIGSSYDFDIYTQKCMNSVGLFPNHVLNAEMFEGYIDNVPRFRELIFNADIECCVSYMSRIDPAITSMATLFAFYHACLMREPRNSHARIVNYQRFWKSRGHYYGPDGPGHYFT